MKWSSETLQNLQCFINKKNRIFNFPLMSSLIYVDIGLGKVNWNEMKMKKKTSICVFLHIKFHGTILLSKNLLFLKSDKTSTHTYTHCKQKIRPKKDSVWLGFELYVFFYIPENSFLIKVWKCLGVILIYFLKTWAWLSGYLCRVLW